MFIRSFKLLPLLLAGVALACGGVQTSFQSSAAAESSWPKVEAPPEPAGVSKGEQRTAVFAGGCFWGVEAVFEHVKGVSNAVSGYSGGTARTANYELVSDGRTKHAEAVRVTYDPAQVSYEQLLEVFFSVAHDPTELNRQGPDIGPQYRSAIFYADEEQKLAAQNYVERLKQAKTFGRRPVVTQIVTLEKFYEAEEYHQNYLVRNPDKPYIVVHDMPKLENLRKRFPALYAKK